MHGGTVAESSFDPRAILEATIEALGRMDVSALEALSAEAETMARTRVRVSQTDAGRALALKDALGELLRSTERSLRMLRGLREAGVRRIEEGGAWER
jgi:hypothetical protein